MENNEKYDYIFYISGGNCRTIRLIPPSEKKYSHRELRDLEGVLLTEKEIPREDIEVGIHDYIFSITKRKEVAEKYKGEYIYFKNN
jgi:hypothetical protein